MHTCACVEGHISDILQCKSFVTRRPIRQTAVATYVRVRERDVFSFVLTCVNVTLFVLFVSALATFSIFPTSAATFLLLLSCCSKAAIVGGVCCLTYILFFQVLYVTSRQGGCEQDQFAFHACLFIKAMLMDKTS